MNEEKIRQIVRDEMKRNYKSGNPEIPPHTHNGTDNLNISPQNIDGSLLLPNTKNGVASPNKLVGQYLNTADGTKPTNNLPSNFGGFPVPIIVGNGVGSSSAFNGGEAPDGTMIFFANGATLSGLWVRFDGLWYRMASSSTTS